MLYDEKQRYFHIFYSPYPRLCYWRSSAGFFVLAIDLVLLRDVGDGLKNGGVILTALRINVVGSYLGFCILLCRATGRPDGYLWCPDQSKAGP
jgi:hypothetical protein